MTPSQKADALYTLTIAALEKTAKEGLLSFLMSRQPPMPQPHMPNRSGTTREYRFTPPESTNSLAPETSLPVGSVDAPTNLGMR